MRHQYHFVTEWRVAGTCGEVADIIGDPLALTRWWPSVHLAVEDVAAGDARGVGRRVRLHTKGWLPCTLRWEFEVLDSRYPNGLTLAAHGDFEGNGQWTFVQAGADVVIHYDWRVRAGKPLLRVLSPVLKPLFAANHRWAMQQGEQSLALELARRRAVSAEARRAVAPPPGPVTFAGVGLVAVAAGAALGAWWLVRRSRRSTSRAEP